jgi:PKHD-type hydroxylase
MRPAARALGDMILTALGQNERFTASALALRVFPPLFNRYDQGMNFGAHIDNAIRFVKGANHAHPGAHRHVGDALPHRSRGL